MNVADAGTGVYLMASENPISIFNPTIPVCGLM